MQCSIKLRWVIVKKEIVNDPVPDMQKEIELAVHSNWFQNILNSIQSSYINGTHYK